MADRNLESGLPSVWQKARWPKVWRAKRPIPPGITAPMCRQELANQAMADQELQASLWGSQLRHSLLLWVREPVGRVERRFQRFLYRSGVDDCESYHFHCTANSVRRNFGVAALESHANHDRTSVAFVVCSADGLILLVVADDINHRIGTYLLRLFLKGDQG